ncbi:hypothetical protein GCM10027422_22020 [Hymenobacter arcticus]
MSLSTKIISSLLAVIIIAVGVSIGLSHYHNSNNPFYSDLSSISSEQELKENYQQHAKALYALKTYFNSITPADSVVEIEFQDFDKISLKIYSAPDTSGHTEKSYFSQWRINPYRYRQSEVLDGYLDESGAKAPTFAEVKARLHWTDNTFRELADRLVKANCIGIRNGEPANISFHRSDFGMYSYNIFNHPIPGYLQRRYNRACTFRPYLSMVVLEYGGGAVGGDCFPDPKPR